jgi:tetratricopeptide (TPR) repeat protein
LYQLLEKAESCYCLRDRRGQYEFGKALALFSSPFDVIGDYYQSSYLHRIGQKQIAYEKLERAQQEAKGAYADRATLTLSGMKEMDGDFDESLKLRLDLAKSDSLSIVVESAIGIASILGSQGDHQEAIEHLERVLPHISKLGNVPLYFDTLNSYAVELAEIGKIELASKVITPVAASAYTRFYLNWIETEKEICEKLPRRSTMTIDRANVIEFPNEEPQEELEEELIEEPRFPFEHYLSNEFGLEDKVENWMYGGVVPNDFGTLMVFLAETEDDIERSIILSKVIDIAFSHSPECLKAKAQWRDAIVSKVKDQ